MKNLKVGLQVLTIKYEDPKGKEYWFEGSIMSFFPPHKPTHVKLRTVQADGNQRPIPIEDIAYVKDWAKNKWIPVAEYGVPKGRKLKPSGEELPDDYGT